MALGGVGRDTGATSVAARDNAGNTLNECHAHGQAEKSVMFRIIPLTLYNGDRKLDTFGFLDEGSSLSMVETNVLQHLGIDGTPEPLRLVWTSNIIRNEKSSRRADIEVSGRGQHTRYNLMSVRTVNHLNLPKQSLAINELSARFDHLKGLPITSYTDAIPRVLIGLDNLNLFSPLETRVGNPGEPVAVRSLLGWTVYGPKGEISPKHAFLHYHTVPGETDEKLNEMIRRRFVLEDTGVSMAPLPEPAEEKRAREILAKTTARVGDRFETGLLWKADDVHFPDSKPMAMRRLKSLEIKLEKDPQLRENVHKQIREYVRKQYAHKATDIELASAEPNRVWYLPLNVVTHPKKPDKKRLVWDAAAQVDGVSLNSRLLKGPDLLTSLPSVICKFREKRIGFGGDICEMFHQIRIKPEDRHSQRFIFRFDPKDTPDVYLMDVATFGASCSPCSAQHVMHRNADEWAHEFPEAAAAIKSKMYMDDYYDSADTPAEAAERAIQVRAVHARAGFDMQKWVSNSRDVLLRLGEKSYGYQPPSAIGQQGEVERVLGILWDPKEDVLMFSANFRSQFSAYIDGGSRPSKRMALRCIMSLFDPLGLLSPFLIHGRIIIQDLWRSGTQWDDEMRDTEYEKWLRWTELLPKIEKLRIPRYYFDGWGIDDSNSLELHIFTDASESAYGCAAYVRVINTHGIKCALVMAKSKVAPLKHQSIPRLELQAAVLGARLKRYVTENHTLQFQDSYLWTDSGVVLSWIRSDHRRYKQYVAHRVGEILSLTQPEGWRWVPSKENVADGLTKWGKDTEPDSNGRWLKGPAFLYLDKHYWPQQKAASADTSEELRTAFLFHHLVLPVSVIDVSRISKWTIVVRTMAFVQRFADNCRRRKAGEPILTVEATQLQRKYMLRPAPAIKTALQQIEYQKAERMLWRIVQGECYPDEVKIFMKNRTEPVKKRLNIEKSSVLYKLSPFMDEHSVLRMDGRNANASYAAFDARFPIILKRDHPITVRLLEHYHQKFGHLNKETVVNEVKQRFEIAHLRVAVDQVFNSCLWCKIIKCKPKPPRMAPLPEQRLTPYLKPFSYTGIDYMGPLEVTVGRRKEKRYIAVFTCLVVRAVHLEVAFNLSTESCISAIRRFVCRRGSPIEIVTDNGTNFVGASRELQKQINADCAATFTDAKTRWTFNPPSAPHMGGVWERMVRSVKEAMRALDNGKKLTDETLATVICEVEEFINTRPLTYMAQGIGEGEALTPNHFVKGSSSGISDALKLPVSLAEALRNSYQRSQYLANEAWGRWLKEYLPSVNRRTKWFDDVRSVKVGDLVYVAEGKPNGSCISSSSSSSNSSSSREIIAV
ncbi:uncharacterized protein LOC128746180 [Sabethes cyaneus]|uniref:uncharacterized protein LOC128746180 n=1 Tax=Sabethes cyaneus TaxID=53552 RepID=UPI00237DDE54|nr:uncharacterized protein LOC128746180 [Sabethes cyaneus]